MMRFEGQTIPAGGRIAVIANDALGNFVVATPLLQMLRAVSSPAQLDYFGGQRTKELQDASDLIDCAIPIHGAKPADLISSLAKKAGSYDFVVNLERGPLATTVAYLLPKPSGLVCGPCTGLGGRDVLPPGNSEGGRLQDDGDWMAEDLLHRHPCLTSGFIGEIFCRVAHLSGPIPRYQVPLAPARQSLPDVLISTAGSGTDKLWSEEGWLGALQHISRKGLTVGLLGAAPQSQREFWKGEGVEERLVESGLVEDLRGQLKLPEVAAALSSAKAVLTIDNGILHLAAASNVPIVGLFRRGIHRLWAPPIANLQLILPDGEASVSSINVINVVRALDRVI